MKIKINYKSYPRLRVMPYSLIELLAAMAVFTILILALMQFTSSAQKIWTGSNAKTMMFEDARIALNLIARDLQCAYYNSTYYGPYKVYDQVATSADFDRIDFVAKLSEKPAFNTGTSSTNLAEVRYWWEGPTAADDLRCKLYRSVVGDVLTTEWNFYTCTEDGQDAVFPAGDINPGTTVNSSDVIPYVVDFSIKPLKATLASGALQLATDQAEFPYAVIISISLLEKGYYLKWQGTGSTDTGHILVKNNKRTFSKIVLLGDRGQN
ncbi:MAG: hypothetical protein A2020_03265 [Lentisphaerae bacterium GWF2_45_14]|nr:MAG: hypothetical protein A2020_03265 [Lentisphaerae bacterium GWF2_45_14]